MSATTIPTDPAAERAVLGAILQAGAECFAVAARFVTAESFHDLQNAAVFGAFADLARDGKPIDPLTTLTQLEGTGKLAAAGGQAYLASLAVDLPDPANVDFYARKVAERARRREAQRLARELEYRVADPEQDGDGLRTGAVAALVALGEDGDNGGPPPIRGAAFEAAVTREALSIRARTEARRRVAAEDAARITFDAALLSETADEPVGWRVNELLASEGRMLLAAQRKVGKTTLTLNLCRSLLVGGDFLGRFHVEPVAGCVAFLNFEVSRRQLTQWAREAGIPGDRLFVAHFRGRSNPFSDPTATAELAKLLREHHVEVLIVDPFGRAYPGTSQNDAGEVTAWLGDLDRFAGAAGCSEVVLTTHAGWDGERTRGTSALEDWADVVCTVVREKEEAGEGARYFRALGRDVEVEEDRLDFDPATRRLTLAGAGNRVEARAHRRDEELIAGVVEAVTTEPGATSGRLQVLMREAGFGLHRGEAGKAAKQAAELGLLIRQRGKGNAFHHSPVPGGVLSPVVPSKSPGTESSSPPPLYIRGTTPGTNGGRVVPEKTDREPGDDDDEAPALAPYPAVDV
jgi:hypothetical protein